MNNNTINDWKKRQPIRTSFLDHTVEKQSIQKITKDHQNIWGKILMGTIWTNKLKKRLGMVEDDSCDHCKFALDIQVQESAPHVLGDCIETMIKLDDLWDEVKNTLQQSGLEHSLITPWFNVSTERDFRWNFPVELGNKGLLPKQLRKRLKAENPHNSGNTINETIDSITRRIQNRIITFYLGRHHQK
jgi:hypothetical protein